MSRVIYITRVDHFNAAHRLHSKVLTDEENQEIFGKCNRPNGHGHNYKVEVTVKGVVNARTGMVMNLTELKEIMQITIINTMDHKNLDQDVPYFENVVSTAENICVFVWEQIADLLPDSVELFEVRIHETEKNVAFYRG